jgi:glycine/D-amino acid oxidase-like deaminating enzyme
MTRTADVVVIGAGIAGIATAHSLSVTHGVERVVIVDPRPAMSVTSDKSTECYRNWWPTRPMIGLMNRSIDLLESMAGESGNVFGLSRRGYLFVTGDESRFHTMVEDAHTTSTLGAGPVRLHPGPLPYRASPADGYTGAPEGADILVGPDEVRDHFPFITGDAVGAIHVRRAGWFSAQQLGAWMLERARPHGLESITGEVVRIDAKAGSVTGVTLADGQSIATEVVVDAAGPFAAGVGDMAGVTLPLFSEVHVKVAYRDHLRIIPRDAPMFIWADPQRIAWAEDERLGLADIGREDLLSEMPIFCHGRPEGGTESPYLLGLWEYHDDVREPEWPLPSDPLYPEVVMRGLTTMIPGLAAYSDALPHSTVDGGYYTKTGDNRPLIGPTGPDGFHLAAGYSGFGVMVAAGGGDLAARHIVGASLPAYADDLLPGRFDDPAYASAVAGMRPTGQL